MEGSAKRSKVDAEITLKEVVNTKQKWELWTEILCSRQQLEEFSKLITDLCHAQKEDESSSILSIMTRQLQNNSEEISRLRKRLLKQEMNASNNFVSQEHMETNNEVNLKEIEVFKSLAEERLKTIFELQSKCDQLCNKLSSVQQQSSNSGNTSDRLQKDLQTAMLSLKEREEEISELRLALSNVRENQSAIINNAYAKIEEQRKSFSQNIENLEVENKRLRKERDNSRLMYEQVVAAARTSEVDINKFNLLPEKVEAFFSKIETLFASINSILQKGEKTDIEETISALFAELETVVSTMNDYEKNVSELRKKVSEGESMIRNLQNDVLRSEFTLNQQRKEAELTITKAMAVEKNALSISEKCDLREREMESRILDSQTKIAGLLLENKTLQDKFRHLNKEYELLKEKMVVVSSEAELRFSQNIRLLEVQNAELRKEVEQFHSAGIKGDTSELDMYKKLLKCNSCHVRNKNALILKCMHVFCRYCLDQRIESRQRKCPNCSESFGANDVKNIFL